MSNVGNVLYELECLTDLVRENQELVNNEIENRIDSLYTSFATKVKENLLDSHVYELCAFCEDTVEINKVVSYCPECHNIIVACSMCKVENCCDCKNGNNFIRK